MLPPFWDYRREYEELRDEILAAVDRVFKSGKLILGPEGIAFERDMAAYVGVKGGVGINSGTDAIYIALAMATATPALAQDSAHPQDVLRVHLDGFRNNNGKAHCSLYNDHDPTAFPEQDERAFKEGEDPSINNEYAEIDFTGIPPGKYALVCYHDENSNGKFDQSALGMPKEGYCFSNNVKPTLSAPNFNQCAFDYKGGDQSIAITMLY